MRRSWPSWHGGETVSTTDDLIALGCGAAVGKVFFWGLILTLGFVMMHPWVLLIVLAIWWLIKKYGAEPIPATAAGGNPPRAAAATLPSGGGAQPRDGTPAGETNSGSRGAGTTSVLKPALAGGRTLVCMTWNVGRRSHAEHVSVLGAAHADIVALQEVAAQHQATLARGLAAQGLVHLHGGPNAPRSFAFTSLIVSRWPLREANNDGPDVPFAERVQVAIVATPFGDVEVLNVHVPAATSSGIAVKVATFEGLARYLACPALIPRIVCGDFNTPKSEAPGRTEYWGSAHQQRTERAVIEGEATTGLRDAFRHVNGPSANAVSWRASNGVARRYDHVFASPELLPIEAAYGDLEEIKVAKMSDHAPLRVVFRAMGAASVSTAPSHEDAPAHPATAREETAMPTIDDTELRAFLRSLTYRIDEREAPDDERRIQFRKGWNRATNRQHMKDATLKRKLTWNNLGYRVGLAHGPATVAKIHEMFDGLAAIYVRDRA